VSNTEGDRDQPERAAFAELEGIVTTVLDQLLQAKSRADDAEAKSVEMEEIVRRFTGDEGEAGRLLSQLGSLQNENTDLKQRLKTGRAGIDRLLAKIRFLEGQP
jgi:hypothetical protein